MTWVLLLTPVVGVIAVVSAVLSLRHFIPLRRTGDAVTVEAAIEKTAIVFGQVLGATIRDERRRGSDTSSDEHGPEELERLLAEQRARRS